MASQHRQHSAYSVHKTLIFLLVTSLQFCTLFKFKHALDKTCHHSTGDGKNGQNRVHFDPVNVGQS